MGILDRELKVKPLDIWGGIYIKELSGVDRAEFEEQRKDSQKTSEQIIQMATFCTFIVCDKNGKRLIDIKDAETLARNKSFESIASVFAEGLALNQMRDEDTEATKKK